MKAVIFDFDGLIVDTEWPAYEAWNSIYQEHGQELKLSDWVVAVGTWMGFDAPANLEKMIGRPLDHEALTKQKEALKADACNTAPALPGVADRLDEAKEMGLRIALVSTSSREWVSTHLARVNLLDRFEIFVTRENVKNVKPHPEPYLNATQQFNIDPKDAVVFEDSLNGVKSAKAAGAKCVAVPNRVTSFLEFGEADLRIQSLADTTLSSLRKELY